MTFFKICVFMCVLTVCMYLKFFCFFTIFKNYSNLIMNFILNLFFMKWLMTFLRESQTFSYVTIPIQKKFPFNRKESFIKYTVKEYLLKLIN